jgi:ketosteroid isomerase-like protein
LADIKSGTLKLESSTMSDMKVQVAGHDMAVMVYRSTDKGTYKGKDVTGEYRWLDVFVKRDGKWQIAIDQGTQIAKQ